LITKSRKVDASQITANQALALIFSAENVKTLNN